MLQQEERRENPPYGLCEDVFDAYNRVLNAYTSVYEGIDYTFQVCQPTLHRYWNAFKACLFTHNFAQYMKLHLELINCIYAWESNRDT